MVNWLASKPLIVSLIFTEYPKILALCHTRLSFVKNNSITTVSYRIIHYYMSVRG